MENIDETEIARLREGDLSAMEHIYNALYGEVFAYSKSYVDDTEQAFEITQDTFVYLWEKRAKLRQDSDIRSYLLRIARNKCLNYFSKLKVERRYHDYVQSREMAVNYEALKDKTAEFALLHELADIIQDALDSLPEPCRIVFEMSRNEELSYPEIANRLNVSVKTVEYRMMQALRIFRTKMLPYLSIIVFFLGVK